MIPPGDEIALLRRYAQQRDEAAFTQIVQRYLNLVYSSAARRVGNRALAEDVTQAVFLILAQKANSIRQGTMLSAWLLKTTRYASANALKMESRRRKHEQQAAVRNNAGACSTNPTDVLIWQEVAQQLDDAVLKLPSTDRQAVLMRYFEDRSIAEIAAGLNLSEGAAKQRLSRATEKLRQKLNRNHLALPAVGGAELGMLLATHAVRAAPAGLLRAACITATSGATAGGAGITIAKGAITMMKWTNAKLVAAIAAAALLTGTGTVLTINRGFAQESPTVQQDAKPLADPANPPSPKDNAADNNAVSIANAPPVVIKAVPEAGTANVDPSITAIKVTYSKEMADGTWSWSTWGDDTFPETTGKPHYLQDKRTCVLPVKLKPGKTYAIWLNSQNFGNFKDAAGHTAVPYLLVFETKK